MSSLNNHFSLDPPQTRLRTDFPKPELRVTCLSDGVQVEVHLSDLKNEGFEGVLYVKGRSKEEQCRRLISISSQTPETSEIFKVSFGTCGLIHINVSWNYNK